MIKRTLVVAIAAALAATAIFSGGAQAATPDFDHRSRTVSYSDLNLAQPDDVRILHRRIVTAARRLCSEPGSWSVSAGADYAQCFRHAVQGAVRRIGNSSLTEAHQERFAWAAEPSVNIRVAGRI